jgi:hypothetical protein
LLSEYYRRVRHKRVDFFDHEQRSPTPVENLVERLQLCYLKRVFNKQDRALFVVSVLCALAGGALCWWCVSLVFWLLSAVAAVFC